MKNKYNKNIKQCIIHLICRKIGIPGNIIIYRYKIILQGNELSRIILFMARYNNIRIGTSFDYKKQISKKEKELYLVS